MQIYIYHNGQQTGPFTEAEVKAQLISGAISLQDQVWWEGQAGWVALGQSSLAATLATAPPPAYTAPAVPAPGMPGASLPHSMVTTPVTSQLAIWSLVCGILSFFCFSLIAAIPSVILGHMARSETKKNPNIKGGGMALAGLILAYIYMGLFICGTVAVVMFGSSVKDLTNQINQQMLSAQSNSGDSDQNTTNSSDQSTPATPPANSSDTTSTNSAPVVNP